jgi:hypothetical protein
MSSNVTAVPRASQAAAEGLLFVIGLGLGEKEVDALLDAPDLAT